MSGYSCLRTFTKAAIASTLFVSNLGFADETISTVLVDQNKVSTATGNVTINNQGSLQMTSNAVNNGDALLIDSDDVIVIMDANNVNPDAMKTTGTGRHGVNILTGATGKNASVTVGSGTSITTVGNAINIDNNNASIVNAGNLKGSSAINITASGQSATVNNLSTGKLESTANAALKVSGVGLNLSNSGMINGIGALTGVELNSNLTSFSNNSTGTMQTATGNAVLVNAPLNGNISNSGLMTASANGNALNIAAALNGSITNSTTGTIQTKSAVAANAGIYFQSAFSIFDNFGKVEATAGGTGLLIGNAAPITGTINNYANATIQSNTGPAINIQRDFTKFNNLGTVQSTTGTPILVTNSPTVTGGIVNNGNIISLGAAPALDLPGAGASNVPLFQMDGTITGNVLLDSSGGTPIDMTGGTIDGIITAFAGKANILKFSGGTVTKQLNLGNIGDTLELGNANMNKIMGGTSADTFNINGVSGSFTELDGNAGANILNFNSSFTNSGPIKNIPTINVNKGSAFTAGAAVTNVDTLLNIKSGGSLITNANVSGMGSFTNDGGMTINNGTNIDLTGAGGNTNNAAINISSTGELKGNKLTQSATGSLNLTILNPTTFGKVTLADTGGAANIAGLINPQLSGGFVPAGTVFNIITATTNNITDTSTLLQPASAVLSFTKAGSGSKIISLTSARTTYASVANSDAARGVAEVLDSLVPNALTGNPDFLALFGGLDTQPSSELVTESLESLVPPFNHSLAGTSQQLIDQAFESIEKRIEDLMGLGPLIQREDTLTRENNGFNFGDPLVRHTYGAWFRLYGSIMDQKRRESVEGYRANATGFGIGFDWRVVPSTVLGVAANVTKADITGRTKDRSEQDVDSYQLTFYGNFDPIGAVFVDAMIGWASNKYNTERNVGIGMLSKTAKGDFHGQHYAARCDVGYAFYNGSMYLAPITTFKYSHLKLGKYTETGAGALNLSVENKNIEELIGGIGIKVAFRNEYLEATYIPEFSFKMFYDFNGAETQTISNFVGGGAAFTTTGIKPQQRSFVADMGLRVHTARDMTFSFLYQIEAKEQYLGHSAYLKLYNKWH